MNAEELRRLSEAATPGPWVPQSPSNGEERDWYLDTHAYEDGPEPVWAPSYPVSEADIVFLAEVVNLYRSNQLQVIERDRLARALDITPGLSIGLMLPTGRLATDMEDIANAILSALDSTTEDPE